MPHLYFDRPKLSNAHSREHQSRDVHDNDDAPNHYCETCCYPVVSHLYMFAFDVIWTSTNSMERIIARSYSDFHVLRSASEPDERSADKRQDDAQRELTAVQCLAQTLLSNSAGNDNGRRDADRTRDETADPRFDSPMQLTF